jgi:hypothetical protein
LVQSGICVASAQAISLRRDRDDGAGSQAGEKVVEGNGLAEMASQRDLWDRRWRRGEGRRELWLQGIEWHSPARSSDRLGLASCRPRLGCLTCVFVVKRYACKDGPAHSNGKRGGPGVALDRITRGNPPAPGESVCAANLGVVQETSECTSCKPRSRLADSTKLPEPAIALHSGQITSRAPPTAPARSWRPLYAVCPQIGRIGSL